MRPEFSGISAVKGGRHPVIEKIIGTTFVPNDTVSIYSEITFLHKIILYNLACENDKFLFFTVFM